MRDRFDRDYYRALGLGPDASEEEIRRAYRRLALQWHPDRNPGHTAAGERFREASEAYAVLIDPAKRSQYDAARRAGAGRGPEFRQTRDDLFRDLFADPRASAVFEEIARELERMGLRVDRRRFEQTLFGGRVVVTGGVFLVGPWTPLLALGRLAAAALRGAGAAREVRAPGVLGALGRAGRWLLGLPPAAAPALGAGDLVLRLRLTRAEAERGTKKPVRLDGPGEEVLVSVPPGIRPGTRLRLRGKGRAGPGGTRGDAYLTVEVES
jgi:curved DNA-binding protein CbpA